jgi:hypothetical protein
LARLTQAGRVAACLPPWGTQFTVNWSKARGWAAYRREHLTTVLRKRSGNLGLAAACSNADPAWVHEWRAAKGALIATGWSADEWTSRSPLKAAEPAVSHGVSFASTAHVALPMDASHVPRWGAQLTANWSRARAWATYHEMQSRFAALIGDREPIMLHGTLPGLGAAPRYMVRIANDSREYLKDLCNKLVAAGGACAVLRNEEDQGARPRDSQSR